MNKYYVKFIVDFSTNKGIELAKRLDVDETRLHLKGFDTKRAMIDWIEENKDGIRDSIMLKPC